MLAFLASGGSATRVAKELYVHQNTVAYRVKRAEEILGRKVTESPIELTCALTLAAVLGPAVLAGEDGGRRARRSGVESLDLGRVLRRDRLALELHRRGQLVAAGHPVIRQDGEPLDLLDARELLVGAVDLCRHLGLRIVDVAAASESSVTSATL